MSGSPTIRKGRRKKYILLRKEIGRKKQAQYNSRKLSRSSDLQLKKVVFLIKKIWKTNRKSWYKNMRPHIPIDFAIFSIPLEMQFRNNVGLYKEIEPFYFLRCSKVLNCTKDWMSWLTLLTELDRAIWLEWFKLFRLTYKRTERACSTVLYTPIYMESKSK